MLITKDISMIARKTVMYLINTTIIKQKNIVMDKNK